MNPSLKKLKELAAREPDTLVNLKSFVGLVEIIDRHSTIIAGLTAAVDRLSRAIDADDQGELPQ